MTNENPGLNLNLGITPTLFDEAEETLRAIRHGAVDAFVIEERDGHRVYALGAADLPYQELVERMQQGAAMLDAQGCILYCNLSLARLLGVSRETICGLYLKAFIASADQSAYHELLQKTQGGWSQGELRLERGDRERIAAHFDFKLLSPEKSAIGVLITDLTERKQQMELASRLQEMQDEERRRIARELHDSVGQLLVAISMNIAMVRAQSDKLDSAGAKAVAENAELIELVSKEIRTVSYLLHPPLLDVAGLISALRLYVEGFSARSKISVDLDVPEDFPRLSDELEIAIFRMIQECLTNIHRHSGSETASIRIHLEAGRMLVQVQDTGKGMPKDKHGDRMGSSRSGVGFAGMRERLTQLGGKLEIQSDARGTLVRAVLPLDFKKT